MIGHSLKQYRVVEAIGAGGMVTRGPLPEKDVVRLGAQVLRAFVAAHPQGVIRRLKPQNLGLSPPQVPAASDELGRPDLAGGYRASPGRARSGGSC